MLLVMGAERERGDNNNDKGSKKERSQRREG